ncbi:MAG: hypothetical protein HGA27_08200 [Peptococcaceae bacterium]|nr:hypothetical protein [Peptococcaceae bacterium]
MHVYIYDGYLGNHKYAKILAKIETRLTDLGLNGKICRLGVIKNYQDLIQGEIRRGAKTLIAVGNDETLNKVINSLSGSDIPVGLIPLDKEKNTIASHLGIDEGIAACDVLSARRLAKIDLAVANSTYFLTEASISGEGTIVDLDKNYTIESPNSAVIKIINLALSEETNNFAMTSPNDGQLELYIENGITNGLLKKKAVSKSLFTADKFYIKNEKESLLLDNCALISPPVEIRVLKDALTLIVGKKRGF